MTIDAGRLYRDILFYSNETFEHGMKLKLFCKNSVNNAEVER